MLTWIVTQSLELCKFTALLGLSLTKPQARHVTNVADALITSEGKHKTLRRLNGTRLDPPTDEFAVADCFRTSPWTATELRTRVLIFVLRFTFELVRRLKLSRILQFSFDDSFCIKDKATRKLEAVDWHHDHTASTKRRKVYHNGSVYVLCHLQMGWIEFTLNWRLYLRKDTVRRLNRHRAADRRVGYQSKLDLVRDMLTEIKPLLPPDFTVYVEFDSWYSAAPLITWIRKQGWQVVGGLKANRQVNHQPLSQRWHALRNTPVELITLQAQDGQETTYRVRSCNGRLNHIADPVQVFVSKRNRRDPHPAYFFCTDLTLQAQAVFELYQGRWRCEVDNWYLSEIPILGKEQLGLADYRVQSLEAILKYHAVVFLSLAYLQWRLVKWRAGDSQVAGETVADMIRLHRHEHLVGLVTAVAEAAKTRLSIRTVVKRFVRPFAMAGM
jgi:DDE superfamily endonuclease